MGNARGDRPLTHVDAPVEVGAIRENYSIRAEASLDSRGRRQLDTLRGDDRPFQLSLHQHVRAAHVGSEVRLLPDRQAGVTDLDVPVHAPLDDDVFSARELAGNDDGEADRGHVEVGAYLRFPAR